MYFKKKNTIFFIVALFIVIMANFLAIDRNSPLRGSRVEEVELPGFEEEHDVRNCNNKKQIRLGTHRSTVWTSNRFSGNFCREITGDVNKFEVDLDAKSGGFDTSVMITNPSLRVDSVNSRTRVSSKIDVRLDGPGEWWAGPKLDTFSSSRIGRGTWHENYVIENASRSPQWYHEDFTGRGKYLGQTNHDGSRYKHYFVKHNSWEQFWAIRQNYRTRGAVRIEPILDMWRDNGLPNDYLSMVKVNVETAGEVSGTVEMSKINIPTWSKR